MKVIDLINRCLKGDDTLPKLIRYFDEKYELIKQYDDRYWYRNILTNKSLLEDINGFYELNNEVEIIEEDKEIEEVNFITEHDGFTTTDQYKLQETINKIIRAVNELRGK